MQPIVENELQMFGRDDPTRTDDPYVPNVVRYQLRYIPFFFSDVSGFSLKEKRAACSSLFVFMRVC